ncbi:hypothetical protein CMQ_4657 [Grosmannia clavigera kw1407]|uniref:Uncharacterized protein n=1 Tax=Grosmannia clavigera (strain kw1407 / UAMH 11150) TaxID=655863 RepID=F0XTI0_GROCL|nr:uncharacterized protein CMQ_4657 [Grosmannia clavigera kw1407]EFW98805.1 hypothetical protein CMQ_4657 [Grosmannia clavigera kw1407]
MSAMKDKRGNEARAAERGPSRPDAVARTKTVVPAMTAADEPPPKVVSADPAMFVPLDFDITEPMERPRSRVDRAQSMLQTADFYRTGVRRGMVYLADLDRRRILATAARAAARPGQKDDLDGLEPDEADVLVHSMQAPLQPAADQASYITTDQELAQHIPQILPKADEPGRKEAGRQLQQVVELVLGKMDSYDSHICAVRSRWAADLEREQKAAVAEQFGKLSTTDDAVGPAASQAQEATATSSEDVGMTGT